MNNKGFNLFTALVAIVLVVLAAILWQTMTGSERHIIDTISDIEEEQKMQTIADLARADALHAFNFGIRFSLEGWLTRDEDPKDGIPDNEYLITQEIVNMSWDEIKSEFARSEFGVCTQTDAGRSCRGTQLAFRTANHLTALLGRTPDVRGYTVDLQEPVTSELQQLLQKVFDKSSEENDFFTVINCSGRWSSCPNGTFYITLNLKPPQEGGSLTEEEYEKFPQIVVTNTLTGRVLKQPILPRGNLQIFVPLRVFKAISGGLEIAREGQDRLFGGEFSAQADSLRVGVCGHGCSPIIDPFNYATFADYEKYACVGDPVYGSGSEGINQIQFSGYTNYEYDPSKVDGANSMRSALAEFVEQELLHPRINKNVQERLAEQENFRIESFAGNAAASANASVLAEPSRKILSIGSAFEGTAYCAKVRSVEAIVVFRDTDERYIVGNVDQSGSNLYAIRILDTTYPAINNSIELENLPVCQTVVSDFAQSCQEA